MLLMVMRKYLIENGARRYRFRKEVFIPCMCGRDFLAGVKERCSS
jgi:hypothetical protein